MSQNAQLSWRWCARLPSAFRSTFRQVDFWPLCLRGIWLAAAILFVSRDLAAEITLWRAFYRDIHTREELIAQSQRAVALFPIDQHIRNLSLVVERAIRAQKAR